MLSRAGAKKWNPKPNIMGCEVKQQQLLVLCSCAGLWQGKKRKVHYCVCSLLLTSAFLKIEWEEVRTDQTGPVAAEISSIFFWVTNCSTTWSWYFTISFTYSTLRGSDASCVSHGSRLFWLKHYHFSDFSWTRPRLTQSNSTWHSVFSCCHRGPAALSAIPNQLPWSGSGL